MGDEVTRVSAQIRSDYDIYSNHHHPLAKGSLRWAAFCAFRSVRLVRCLSRNILTLPGLCCGTDFT